MVKRPVKNMRTFVLFLISYGVVFVLPMLLFFYTYQKSMDSMQENARNISYSALENCRTTLEGQLDKLESVTAGLPAGGKSLCGPVHALAAAGASADGERPAARHRLLCGRLFVFLPVGCGDFLRRDASEPRQLLRRFFPPGKLFGPRLSEDDGGVSLSVVSPGFGSVWKR